MVKAAADIDRDLGFSERNVLVSASHTHASPGGFANFATFNTLAPSLFPPSPPSVFIELFAPRPTDRQLYTFIVRRVALAIRRAAADLAPAASAWGSASLLGVTENRSLEAHLADHAIVVAPHRGSVSDDPAGYAHTVDPAVDVLRVDKLLRRRIACSARDRQRRCWRRAHVPIGGFSTFANHGTVNSADFEVYNRDHHGAAVEVFEAGVRKAGRVPGSQLVVNVYGNSDEGDQSAGLHRRGPAYAESVGRREAVAMLTAWRRAGSRLSARPVLDLRWTRVCFCGQAVQGGRVADQPATGLAALGGSEEGRTHLGDREGDRSAIDLVPSQGHKLALVGLTSKRTVPGAAPLLAARVGDHLIVSYPGEATVEVGRRLRAAVMAAVTGSGVRRVVVSGLANEYLLYFTTPEEYDRQHYEGGFTVYGPSSSMLVQEQVVELASRLVHGDPAQPAYAFDPTNGIGPDGPAYGDGAPAGQTISEPDPAYPRLAHAHLTWRGGGQGLDRPLDRAFVVVERRAEGRWRAVADDLGLEIVWRVDAAGRYDALWEIPLSVPLGRYRIVVVAKRYRLDSRPFAVTPSTTLRVRRVPSAKGRAAVVLAYPQPVENTDFTWRPRSARGGAVAFRIGSRTTVVRRVIARVFSVAAPAGTAVEIEPGGARDRFGNTTGEGLRLHW